MKKLLTTIGLGLMLTVSAAAQENPNKQDNPNKPKKEKKVNPRSNSKNNPNRTFGKERAATVQEQNGKTKQVNKDSIRMDNDTAVVGNKKANKGKGNAKSKNKPANKGKQKSKSKGQDKPDVKTEDKD